MNSNARSIIPGRSGPSSLHPAQRALVERDYSDPARVAGSAGTGKTIVALHRSAFLARANPGALVLLTTFSEALANALSAKLSALVDHEPRLADASKSTRSIPSGAAFVNSNLAHRK